jgi:hypothetical protein
MRAIPSWRRSIDLEGGGEEESLLADRVPVAATRFLIFA